MKTSFKQMNNQEKIFIVVGSKSDNDRFIAGIYSSLENAMYYQRVLCGGSIAVFDDTVGTLNNGNLSTWIKSCSYGKIDNGDYLDNNGPLLGIY